MSQLASSEFSIFWLVTVAEETSLNLTLSETPKTGFVTTRPNYNLQIAKVGIVSFLFSRKTVLWFYARMLKNGFSKYILKRWFNWIHILNTGIKL